MSKRRMLAALAALALGAAFVGCGSDDEPTATEPDVTEVPATEPVETDPPVTEPVETDPPATEPPATDPPATDPPATDPPVTEPVETVAVGVYWAWVIPTTTGTPERLGAGGRDVSADDAVLGAMQALLDGPNAVETELGMATAIPEDTRVLGVVVDGGTATVDLSAEFEASSGSLDELTRLGQVVFTLTAFDDVERVRFSIDGEPRDEILSHGVLVGEGLTRDDFAEIRPLIMVESPVPGEVVTGDELTVTGESNTFEANVQWNLVDGEGRIVDEGFTTATAGMGTWGEFTFTADLTGISTERGAIIVFESSPRDGSLVNVVEIPFLR